MLTLYFVNGSILTFFTAELEDYVFRDGSYVQFTHKGKFYFIPYANLLYFTETLIS